MKEGWEYKKLSDIYDVRDGTHDSPSYIPNGFPLVTSKNLCNGKIDMSKINYISEDDYLKINERSKVDVGDVLFAMIGTIGNPVLITEEPKFAIKNMALFKVPFNQSGKYLFYLLSSKVILDKMKEESRGGTQKFVSLKYLRNFKIRLPKIEEQQHIVEELDLLSSIIEKKKAQLNELDNLAQSLFYEMFGDPITNEKGWEIKKIGEIGSVERGAGISKKDFVDNGLPCIHYGQLHTIFGPTTYRNKTYIPADLLPKYKIAHPGDVIMAITSEDVEGSCKSTAWLGNFDVVVGSDAAIFHHSINGVYISYYTMTKAFYNEKAKYANGFKVTHISAKEIESIPIPLPPLYLQKQFAKSIETIEHQKELIKQSIKEVETLFNSRMDYYFN